MMLNLLLNLASLCTIGFDRLGIGEEEEEEEEEVRRVLWMRWRGGSIASLLLLLRIGAILYELVQGLASLLEETL
jgi:hypothetical protein